VRNRWLLLLSKILWGTRRASPAPTTAYLRPHRFALRNGCEACTSLLRLRRGAVRNGSAFPGVRANLISFLMRLRLAGGGVASRKQKGQGGTRLERRSLSAQQTAEPQTSTLCKGWRACRACPAQLQCDRSKAGNICELAGKWGFIKMSSVHNKLSWDAARSALECGGSTPPWNGFWTNARDDGTFDSGIRSEGKAVSSHRTPRRFAQRADWL